MSDFTAFFPYTERQRAPDSFERLKQIYADVLDVDQIYNEDLGHAYALRTLSFGQAPKIIFSEDSASWILNKGIYFHVDIEPATSNSRDALNQLLSNGTEKLFALEGTFAIATWNGNKRQGWILNDQASSMNLYYGEHDKGLYVTTNAMTLAKALGLTLNPLGVQEFFVRDEVLAPTTMFEGLKRLDVGEHLEVKRDGIRVKQHWNPYATERQIDNINQTANSLCDVVVDRMRRYTSIQRPVICDLTGGYDSRLTSSAVSTVTDDLNVTVNGPKTDEDVRIAHKISDHTNWPLHYFNTDEYWQTEVTPELRREFVYRSNGELRFNEIYHHYLSRPELAKKFKLHIIGGGGELFRYHPWSQEFFGIGRRRKANIRNALNYRYFKDSIIRSGLFRTDFQTDLKNRFGQKLDHIFSQVPGSRTTQQLDAAYVWKKTGNPALYLSSTYNWLPTVAPLLTAGVIESTVSLPWSARLTTHLQRLMIQELCPTAAKMDTTDGGTGSPFSVSNSHKEAVQLARRAWKLTKHLDRVLLGGTFLGKSKNSQSIPRNARVPFFTPEFQSYIAFDNMMCSAIFNPDCVKNVLHSSGQFMNNTLILRIATIEQLCRELDFRPDSDFLSI